jgi:hypothetical protein
MRPLSGVAVAAEIFALTQTVPETQSTPKLRRFFTLVRTKVLHSRSHNGSSRSFASGSSHSFASGSSRSFASGSSHSFASGSRARARPVLALVRVGVSRSCAWGSRARVGVSRSCASGSSRSFASRSRTRSRRGLALVRMGSRARVGFSGSFASRSPRSFASRLPARSHRVYQLVGSAVSAASVARRFGGPLWRTLAGTIVGEPWSEPSWANLRGEPRENLRGEPS